MYFAGRRLKSNITLPPNDGLTSMSKTMSSRVKSPITQFRNCRILYQHAIIREDLWVRDGKILNPEWLFFIEKGHADFQVDCKDCIISPGFIDTQINGKFKLIHKR